MLRSVPGPVVVVIAFAVALFSVPSGAQEAPILQWEVGPATAPIGGSLAEIDLTESFVFLGKEDTETLLELMENPLTGQEMATVAPVSDEASWFLFFEWDPIGYVEDTEKDQLDADAMLKSIREGTEAANVERRKRGWSTMDILGWRVPPHYDEVTNNLTWAIDGASQGEPLVNRLTKLLGRRGVMTVTLVSSVEEYDAAARASDALLGGFRFQSGNRYAEFLPGRDQVAKYGLSALVVGGAAAALAKSGFLARFWKLLVVGAAAALAAVKRFFSKRPADTTSTSTPQI